MKISSFVAVDIFFFQPRSIDTYTFLISSYFVGTH